MWSSLTAESYMKHRRVGSKKIKQMMDDLGITDNAKLDDDQQLLLEQRQQSVSDDKQITQFDSENK
ncbi:hypothetical protein C9J48_02715 [Photobacterium profundum]|nr:hypothetical protein C9J48_02715 [Photobacterium profundum]